MDYITYKDLAARYGQRPALNILYLLERLTKIQNEITSMNVDARFDRAIKALADTDVTASSQG